jgi:diguanylate cyclase (GGDEF)-like protein
MTANSLWADRIRELRTLERELADMTDARSARERLTTRLSAIFRTPAALLDRPAKDWRLAASSGEVPAREMFAAAARQADEARGTGHRVVEVALGDDPWTGLLLSEADEPPLVVFIRGDWTALRLLLTDWIGQIVSTLRRLGPPGPRPQYRRLALALTMPKRLAAASDAADIYQIIADTCAKTVGARTASVAIYNPERNLLAVAATQGYPVALVRQVRVRPGTGIIGSVFKTGRALCLADVRRHYPAAPPRRRYHTQSCIAMPLRGSSGTLGVVSVADRVDGRAFDRRDLRAIHYVAMVAYLALERASAVAQAQASLRAASTDALTTLFNRWHFEMRLEEEVERARRHAVPLTLLMLDLDNLKQINDRSGHAAGDAVLRLAGDVLHRLTRLFDICARLGGDEFAVLMPGSGAEDGRLIAERIRAGIEEARPAGSVWAEEIPVTASVGVATFDGSTGELLLRRADQALYAAKSAGRNRVITSAPES